jgi:hypothetical protein
MWRSELATSSAHLWHLAQTKEVLCAYFPVTGTDEMISPLPQRASVAEIVRGGRTMCESQRHSSSLWTLKGDSGMLTGGNESPVSDKDFDAVDLGR